MTGQKFVVTGTDTGLGKTVFAAALTAALEGIYWKPIQAGLENETDSEVVARLSQRPVLQEIYRLALPASPHKAAAAEGITINPARLVLPHPDMPLIVEGAGGLLVPLTEGTLFIDVFARWNVPLILCARTALGTINHTLLSLEAIRTRAIPLLGVAFIGAANDESQRIIAKFSGAKILGRLPQIALLNTDILARAFAEGFDVKDFA